MTDLFAHEDTTPTDKLPLGRLRYLLWMYWRAARFPEYMNGELKGLLGQLKSEKIKPHRLEKAQQLVREERYVDGTELMDLIDDDDRPEVVAAERERAETWAEF